MSNIEPYEAVEKSPNERYLRYNHKIGSGSSKIVWKAFDTLEGKIVAWNSAKCMKFNDDDNKRIENEITILKTLRHEHILTLYDSWQDLKNGQMIFITDLMPDGCLREFMSKVGHVKRCVIKNWCRQIL